MDKMKFTFYFLFSVFSFCTSLAYCQNSANTSGGDAAGSGGSVAYSIGQVFYTSIGDGTASLSQGIQQAFEIFKVNTIETESKIHLKAYPNPTMGFLVLTTDYIEENLSYQIFDNYGNPLDLGQIETQTTYIDLNHLSSATYFLNIISSDNVILQSFKIIKN